MIAPASDRYDGGDVRELGRVGSHPSTLQSIDVANQRASQLDVIRSRTYCVVIESGRLVARC